MKHAFFLTTAVALTLPAFAGAHELRYRLVVADSEAPQISVLDVGADTDPMTFEIASPARVHLGPDGRHAWAVQGEAGVVQVLDTGLIEEDHGDHSALILEAPALLPGSATGERPVHFNMDDDTVAIFWDGSGTATLHENATAASGDLSAHATIDTGKPHHGVAVPVGDHMLITLPPEGEGLPDALAVVGADGAEMSRVDCLNLHGEGKAGGFIAFGCQDGVAIFDTSQTPPTGRFVAYPDDAPEGGMVRLLLSPRDTLALVGNFGTDHLTIFDPSAESGDFTFVASPVPGMAFALNDSGMEGFSILSDGRLVHFSALTGRILGEATGIVGPYAMERGVIRPMMDVTGDRVAISDPAAGQVVLVDTDTLEVVDRIDVGNAPRSLLILAAEAEHIH
ncbi:YncE family protein [Thalassococcus sp. S3]|uniref:YncE family protein n=1 Tax=Thalassococcus sp. S3 TaxID=2017482 RepID=UPI0010244848|nr:hypothetical protein [Thalassococcus sp. S3]QBF32650.1 hypothetical protein CFI11_15705 [Thalassococcus sp. S3]